MKFQVVGVSEEGRSTGSIKGRLSTVSVINRWRVGVLGTFGSNWPLNSVH